VYSIGFFALCRDVPILLADCKTLLAAHRLYSDKKNAAGEALQWINSQRLIAKRSYLMSFFVNNFTKNPVPLRQK
jgi:hypothetical protein